MKTQLLPLSGLTLFAILLICMGNFDNYTAGHTGAPGENTCKTCHTIPTAGMSGGYLIEDLPATVIGGQTYPITLSVYTHNEISETAGFQMNFLNEDGTSHGMLSESDTYSTIAGFGNRTYVQQNTQPRFFGDAFEDTIFFHFNWTPESVDVATPVQNYYGIALGNGNYGIAGGQRGDSILMGMRTLNVVPLLTAEIMILSTPSCHGEDGGSLEVTYQGGLPPVTLIWSTGDQATTLSDLPAGAYSVTVADAAGQQIVLNADITEPPELIADIDPEDPSCHDTQDGTIAFTSDGGTPPYLYQLDGQSVTNPASGLGPGSYMWSVSDDNGCISGGETVLSAPDSIFIEIIEIFPQSTSANGSIIIEVSGGILPYNFFWTGPNDYTDTEQNPQDLEAGDYFLTVTDANGCTQTFTTTVEFASALTELSSAIGALEVFPNPGSDLLQLRFPQEGGLWEVRCTDVLGNPVWHDTVEPVDRTFTLSQHWPAGVYLITAKHSGSGSILSRRWIRTGK